MSLRVAVASTSRLPSLALSSSAPTLSRFYRRGPLASPHVGRPTDRPFTPTAYKPIYNPAVDNPPATPLKWTPQSRRAGVIGVKKGMTTLYDGNGRAIPVTIVQVKECQVLYVSKLHPAHNGFPDHHYIAIGALNRRKYEINPKVRQRLGLAPTRKTKPYKTTASMLGHYNRLGLVPKKKVIEFKITPDALLPIGSEFSVCHFVPGQMVDLKGTSKGKGTAGVMKRHGFSGGTMSHGNSKAHRSAGSTGMNQDPGRVLPGKKMSGRMGCRSSSTPNTIVQRIDTTLNLLYLRGPVPGPKGSYVKISDALKGVVLLAQKNAKKGIAEDKVLGEHILTLPFPMGDMNMAKTLPVVVDAATGKVKSGFANF